MFLHEISFVFALEVHSPSRDRVLKFLFLVVIAFLQNLDRLGIRKPLKIVIANKFKLLHQAHFTSLILWKLFLFLREALSEELKVFVIVVHRIADNIPDKLL